MFAASLLLATALLVPQESEVYGRALPTLDVLGSLQGESVDLSPQIRRVRVFELFAIADEVSFTSGLPLLRDLAQAHAKDSRVQVFGIATGVTDGADDGAMRAKLASSRFYLPVLRDRGGSVAKLAALGGKVGTPRTLVVDRGGIVRWHGTVDSPQAATAVRQAIADALAAFFVEPIRDLPVELAAYAKGNLPAAASAARKILADNAAPPEQKAMAEKVDRALEAGALQLVDDAQRLRKEGYPDAARSALEDASTKFAVVASANEAARLLALWSGEREFKRELSCELQLRLAMKIAESPKDASARLKQRLEKILETFRDTPIAPRIQQALATLA